MAVLAVVTAFVLPFNVMAATWNASSFDDIRNAFDLDDEDTVYIILEADIEWGWDALEAKEGQVYYINGEAYTLTGVRLAGSGTVEITTAEVVGADNSPRSIWDPAAVYTEGSVDVTINSDVVADTAGIIAGGESTVTVNGNVTAGSGNGAAAIEAYEESTVNVTGDVTGNSGNPDDVDLSDPEAYSDGADAVHANDESTVNVGGDVTGGDGYGTWSYAGDGIVAVDDERMEVSYDDYDEANRSTVTVGGNVTGGSVIADSDTAYVEGNTSDAGEGIVMSGTASVEVQGDVKGGDNSAQGGDAGNGVYIVLSLKEIEVDGEYAANEQGSLYTGGTVIGGTATAEDGVSASGIFYANVWTEDGYRDEWDYDEMCGMGDAADFYMPGDLFTDAEVDYVLGIGQFGAVEVIGELADYYELDAESLKAEYLEGYEELLQKYGMSLVEDEESYEKNVNIFASLSEEQTEEFTNGIVELYNGLVNAYAAPSAEDMNVMAPEITVFAIVAGEGAEFAESNVAAVAEEIFEDDINYIIKTENAAGGTVTVDKATAKAGETVVVFPRADEGYKVSKVFVSGVEIEAVDGAYSFEVPEGGGVIVTAEFEKEVVSSTVKTGDYNQTGLYLGLMMVSAMSVCAVLVLKKKRL